MANTKCANLFDNIRRKILSTKLNSKISFRYVEIVHSKRSGRYLTLEFDAVRRLTTAEELTMEDLLYKSFGCRTVESFWTHQNKIFLVFFNFEDIDLTRMQEFSNFSNNDRKVLQKPKKKSEKKKAYNDNRLQQYQLKKGQNKSPMTPQNKANTVNSAPSEKWSLSESSTSVKSMRSLWDSIERLGSPDGLTNSERVANKQIEKGFQLFSEKFESLQIRLEEQCRATKEFCEKTLSEQSQAIKELAMTSNANNKLVLEQNEKLLKCFEQKEQSSGKPISKSNISDLSVKRKGEVKGSAKNARKPPRRVVCNPEESKKLYAELERNLSLIKDPDVMDKLLEAAKIGDRKLFYATVNSA